ncbi:hypothetical protein CRYUN_Cryun37aG0018600 [Craigia yunnanensis]
MPCYKEDCGYEIDKAKGCCMDSFVLKFPLKEECGKEKSSNRVFLHLQDNQLTGTLNFVADLPLNDLNVEINKFTGWIPDELNDIDNLQKFLVNWAGYHSIPGVRVYHRHPNGEEKQSHGLQTSSVVNAVIIAVSCLGALLVVALLIAVFSRRMSPPPSSHFLDEKRISGRTGFTPLQSQELRAESYVGILEDPKDFKSIDSVVAIDMKSLQKSPSIGLKHSVSYRVSFSQNEFASRLKGKRSTSVHVVPYSLADLLNASGNFASGRLFGYLHDIFSPPIVHKNIKSSNILLDLELNPHPSDYAYKPKPRNGIQCSRMHKASTYTLKSDVYGFGVMLELLTGRMPLDSKRPKSEQCLVKWDSPQLNDIDTRARMSDPKLRPSMSELVQALVRLVQQSSINMRDDLSTSCRTEDSDY